MTDHKIGEDAVAIARAPLASSSIGDTSSAEWRIVEPAPQLLDRLEHGHGTRLEQLLLRPAARDDGSCR